MMSWKQFADWRRPQLLASQRETQAIRRGLVPFDEWLRAAPRSKIEVTIREGIDRDLDRVEAMIKRELAALDAPEPPEAWPRRTSPGAAGDAGAP